MLGQQFYHETIRRVVVSFGTIFNDIHLVRKDNDGNVTQSMKVPLAYGPRQKFLVRLGDNPDLGKHIPIVLTNVGYEDDYQGDFTARRSIIYSLDFTAKFYLYGPVTSAKVIKTVQADQFTDLPDKSPKREQRYTVSPSPITADADDDFGFNETTSFFQDAAEGE